MYYGNRIAQHRECLMKITFRGEYTNHQLRQVLFEQLAHMEDRFLVRHCMNITLYLTPTNGFGSERYCIDELGRQVRVLTCLGPYQPAADEYGID